MLECGGASIQKVFLSKDNPIKTISCGMTYIITKIRI